MMNWQSVHYIFMPYGFRDTCSSAEKVRLGVRHAQRGWGMMMMMVMVVVVVVVIL